MKTNLKKLIAMVVIAFSMQSAIAQSLTTPGGTIGSNTTTNSVGIGTSNPQATLDIVGSSSPNLFQLSTGLTPDFFKIQNGTSYSTFMPTLWGHNTYSGNPIPSLYLIGSTNSASDNSSAGALVNINGRQYNGTTSSAALQRNVFQVSNYTTTLFTINPTGIATLNPSSGGLQWGNSSGLGPDQGGSVELGGSNSSAGTGVPYIDFHYNGLVQDYNVRLQNSASGILQLQGGGLAIGTNCALPSGALLAVNGGIYATNLKIKLTNGSGCFPDYVFEKGYKLLSLRDVEKYIQANKHLPDVPSAKEVEAGGMDVPEMNMILLRKVEELTLHMIDLKKANDALNAKNEALNAQLGTLSQKVEELQK